MNSAVRTRYLPSGEVDIQNSTTETQLQVFLSLCERSIKGTASKLKIKENTIAKHYIHCLSLKLKTTHRGQWMKMAIKQGLITV